MNDWGLDWSSHALLSSSSSLRSHPAILKIPNELFYENELQVFADQWEREAYCNWEHLPKKVWLQGQLFVFKCLKNLLFQYQNHKT